MRTALMLSALIGLTACGPTRPLEDADAGAVSDAAPTCPELQTAYPDKGYVTCGTECVALMEDTANCGGCGDRCDADRANSCNDAYCGCGTGFACQPPSYCVYDGRASICVAPDYAGETCDGIDVGCPEGRVCAGNRCTVPTPTLETCDGFDNDHDGHVDEAPDGRTVWERDCYSGSPETADVGECRSGTEACIGGNWSPCFGEVLPIPETGLFNCDMRDNDCNGCVDDRIEDGVLVCGGDFDGHQITMIIDISGSMSDDLSAVVTASATFGAPYAPIPYIEWGIMLTGKTAAPYYGPHLPMTSFPAFNVSLGALSTATGGAKEPSWQAVHGLASGTFDASMGIDPAPNQIYIVFTDEDAGGVSTSNNTTGLTESEVCAAVNARGATLAVFTDDAFFTTWDECAIVYEITTDAADMAAKMNDLLDNICGL